MSYGTLLRIVSINVFSAKSGYLFSKYVWDRKPAANFIYSLYNASGATVLLTQSI